jgi:hypothetical protein
MATAMGHQCATWDPGGTLWLVWPSRGQAPQPDDQDQKILPEKVAFTPRPGVLLPNAIGHQIHWLQEGDNVAYTLLAEHDPSRGAAEQLARSLVTI